jgi:hypothetical protein
MQIDHDIILLLVGAGIGLSSSLITSLFQAWLSRREFDRRLEQEKKAELKRIVLPTASEVSRFSPEQKMLLEGIERCRDAPPEIKKSLSPIANKDIFIYRLRSKLSHISEFVNKHFAVSLLIISIAIVGFGYLIYKLLLLNLSPILLSIIVAVVLFLFTRLTLKLIKNKIMSDKQARILLAEKAKRIAEGKERTAKLPKCPKCGLPFISDYEVDQHIKRWHSQ